MGVGEGDRGGVLHACSEAAGGRHKVCVVESVDAILGSIPICDCMTRSNVVYCVSKMQHVLAPLVFVRVL